ncbi:alpha-1,3/1,6-mannosyltransferase ALG2 [Anoplophora glabripennis]|nr:alpha-1,3/1,6-mannosyltransferase ALG2 [Anoplophora glabripennis]
MCNRKETMNNKKKFEIAFIHPDLGIGGAERLVLDVAAALSNEGYRIRFITNHFDKSHSFDELKNEEFPVEVYGDWIPRSVFGKCSALCAYIRMIYLALIYILFFKKKEKPDLYFVDLIPIAIPFLKLANEKVIYYCHHPDLLASTPGGKLKQLYRKPINWLELKATARADIILVNSEYTASIFRKTFPGITHALDIVYPTIAYSYQKAVENLKGVKPISELVPEINSKENDVIFLSVNRFHPAKKLDLAILAMNKLKSLVTEEDWKRIYLIMAGGYDPQSKINKETYAYLTELTNQMNLQDKIIYLKSPSDNMKTELLNSCTCLLYTPVNEHFGIVPLEAMMVAKPVIAVNSGGPRETVDHGITGYLCEPTAESMAEFMYRICSDNKTKDMGFKGKMRLQQKFSHKYFTHCLKRVVNKVLQDDDNKKSN